MFAGRALNEEVAHRAGAGIPVCWAAPCLGSPRARVALADCEVVSARRPAPLTACRSAEVILCAGPRAARLFRSVRALYGSFARARGLPSPDSAKKRWIVYAKRPFARVDHVLKYHCPHCGEVIEHRPVPARIGRAPPPEAAA